MKLRRTINVVVFYLQLMMRMLFRSISEIQLSTYQGHNILNNTYNLILESPKAVIRKYVTLPTLNLARKVECTVVIAKTIKSALAVDYCKFKFS